MKISTGIHLVFRALFSKNNDELGKNGILGQAPSAPSTSNDPNPGSTWAAPEPLHKSQLIIIVIIFDFGV